MNTTMSDRYTTFLTNHVEAMSGYSRGEYEAARNAAFNSTKEAQGIIQTLAEKLLHAEIKACGLSLDEILVYLMVTEEWDEEKIAEWEDVEDGLTRFDIKTEMEDFMEMKGEVSVNEENLADFIIWYHTCRGDNYETGSLYDFIIDLKEFYKRRK